mmetsp:Transcript_49264/g.136925  ORF Transcript_49264/g.136925 Transcript_49264/m.136925 type:complete len:293 (-) Transcript_49264:1761-2639(-)
MRVGTRVPRSASGSSGPDLCAARLPGATPLRAHPCADACCLSAKWCSRSVAATGTPPGLPAAEPPPPSTGLGARPPAPEATLVQALAPPPTKCVGQCPSGLTALGAALMRALRPAGVVCTRLPAWLTVDGPCTEARTMLLADGTGGCSEPGLALRMPVPPVRAPEGMALALGVVAPAPTQAPAAAGTTLVPHTAASTAPWGCAPVGAATDAATAAAAEGGGGAPSDGSSAAAAAARPSPPPVVEGVICSDTAPVKQPGGCAVCASGHKGVPQTLCCAEGVHSRPWTLPERDE